MNAGRSTSPRLSLAAPPRTALTPCAHGNVCSHVPLGTQPSMDEIDNLDETVALSAEELDAMGVVIEEEDEAGAPEKVAWPIVDDEERLASAEDPASE